jgi:hypothetical protein
VKDVKPPTPFACINRRSFGRTYCDRGYDAQEFLFADADFAIQHYDTPKVAVRVCTECIAAAKKIRAEENDVRRK